MMVRYVRPFRVKMVDLAYCGRCIYYLPVSRGRYDFCRYDGMPLDICPEDDIEFTCKSMVRMSYVQLNRYWLSFTSKTK